MENFSTEEDVAAVGNYPIGSTTGNKDMNNPVRVDSFEGFSKIRKQYTMRMRCIVQKVLDIEVIKLRFTEHVEEGLCRVEST